MAVPLLPHQPTTSPLVTPSTYNQSVLSPFSSFVSYLLSLVSCILSLISCLPSPVFHFPSLISCLPFPTSRLLPPISRILQPLLLQPLPSSPLTPLYPSLLFIPLSPLTPLHPSLLFTLLLSSKSTGYVFFSVFDNWLLLYCTLCTEVCGVNLHFILYVWASLDQLEEIFEKVYYGSIFSCFTSISFGLLLINISFSEILFISYSFPLQRATVLACCRKNSLPWTKWPPATTVAAPSGWVWTVSWSKVIEKAAYR